MITISLFNHVTGLPLPGRAIQLVFTDTAFGWMRLQPTDEDGITTVRTKPGPARVYVDGELLGEYWLKEKMEIPLKKGHVPVKLVEAHDLVCLALPTPAKLLEVQAGKLAEKQIAPSKLFVNAGNSKMGKIKGRM